MRIWGRPRLKRVCCDVRLALVVGLYVAVSCVFAHVRLWVGKHERFVVLPHRPKAVLPVLWAVLRGVGSLGWEYSLVQVLSDKNEPRRLLFVVVAYLAVCLALMLVVYCCRLS